MNWRHYLILFLVGLIVPFTISRFQSLPGYMDADYYFAGGMRVAQGYGFSEPYLWNYLNDPAALRSGGGDHANAPIRSTPPLVRATMAACVTGTPLRRALTRTTAPHRRFASM